MTKSKALFLLKVKYYDFHIKYYSNVKDIPPSEQFLCNFMPSELMNKWFTYWLKISKDKAFSLKDFDETLDSEELYLFRLLTAIWFIEDTYKD